MKIEFGHEVLPPTPYRDVRINGRDFGRIHKNGDGRFRAQIDFGGSFTVTAFGYGETELEAIQAATVEADRLIQLSIDRLAELRAALEESNQPVAS